MAAAREVAARVRGASVLRAFAAASHALDLLRDPQTSDRLRSYYDDFGVIAII